MDSFNIIVGMQESIQYQVYMNETLFYVVPNVVYMDGTFLFCFVLST